jgi:hypothetical protein
MKKNWEYIILALLMIPSMVSAVILTIQDFTEQKQYDKVVNTLEPKIMDMVENAKDCNIKGLPPTTFNEMGKTVNVNFEQIMPDTFNVYIRSTFQDGFRQQRVHTYSFYYAPDTGLCRTRQIVWIPETEKLNEQISAATGSTFRITIPIPSISCK